MLWVAVIVLSCVSAGALAWGAYAWAGKRAAQAALEEARAQRDESRQQADTHKLALDGLGADLESLRQGLADQRVANGRLEEKLRGAEEAAQERQKLDAERLEQERAQRAEDDQRLQDAFSSLAGTHLAKAGEQLLKLAGERFAAQDKAAQGELDKRKTAIDELVKPLREAMQHQQARLEQMRVEQGKSQATLHQRLEDTLRASAKLSETTDDLVRALKRPGVRGRWGELQLRRVAELAGMIEHCDFVEQASVTDEDDQRHRPDMVVKLPAERTIVVDAKTSLQAYLEAIEAETDDQREQHLKRHVAQIDERVKELSLKAYQAQFDRSPDFVVLFIPGEAFLQAAAARDAGLLERAMNRGVLIASPMTLIAVLKAVAMGWREQRLAESAEEIRRLGQEMHERFALLSEKLEKLGRAVGNSVKSYNEVVGSFESRLLVTARKFRDLGADSNKELPAEGVSGRVDEPVRLPQAVSDDGVS